MQLISLTSYNTSSDWRTRKMQISKSMTNSDHTWAGNRKARGSEEV